MVGPHGSAHAGDALIRSVLSEDFNRTGNDNYLVMQVIHSIFQQLTVTLRIGLFGACLDPNITTAVTSSPIGRAQTLVLGGAGEKPLACEQMPQMSLDDPIAQGLGYFEVTRRLSSHHERELGRAGLFDPSRARARCAVRCGVCVWDRKEKYERPALL